MHGAITFMHITFLQERSIVSEPTRTDSGDEAS